jgi:DNA-binding SARP family transcriptional activator
MEFRVLGPVELHSDNGEVLTLPRRQERCLLAVLLLEVGRAVPRHRLRDLLWEGAAPPGADQALRTYVARIRSLLAQAHAIDSGVALLSDRGGYVLKADPETIDAHRFRRLLNQAVETAGLTERDALLREALASWHGPPLYRAAPEELRERLCRDLMELHVRAQEEALAAGIELGRSREVLPQAVRLHAENPGRERIVELYMLALYEDGRTREALDLYARTRQHLADDLGLDPGPALQRLHQAILRGQQVVPPRPADRPGTPAQLPPDLAGFVGRTEHLRQLDALVAGDRTAVVITAISGTAGVGKTTLAVHWAHRVRDQFPDGQLYLNLRGFDPDGSAVDPGAAVRRLIEAFDLPAQRIPADLDGRAALYRTLLADKKMLVLLDNARDTEQVRQLMPATPGCLALITSRNHLAGLVATDAAAPLMLDLLTTEEAGELLARRLGVDRTRREPEAVEEIVQRCGRLPLALAIVAARAATQPRLSLAALARQLRDAHGTLAALDGGDRYTDIRAVFSWSYNVLTPPAARLFRLLGLHPGPDLSAAAAASLAGLPPDETMPLLAELTRTNLVVDHGNGRYTLHDLLRAYAADRAGALETEEHRRAAIHRLLDHYVQAAYAAHRLLYPPRDPPDIPVSPAGPDNPPERLRDLPEAVAWLTVEYPALLAAVRYAAAHGFDVHTWQLVWALNSFLDRHSHWHDLRVVSEAAVQAAGRLGHVTGKASAHRRLARACALLDEHAEAHANLRDALALYTQAGDQVGQAHVHRSTAFLLNREDRTRDALEHAEQSLALFRAAAHTWGHAYSLNMVGWYHLMLGDSERALTYGGQALPLLEQMGDRDGEAFTWDTLGYAHHHAGNHGKAEECFARALALFRELGNRYFEGVVLEHLGESCGAAGDQPAVRDAWKQAVAIFRDLNHPRADEVQAKLDQLPG